MIKTFALRFIFCSMLFPLYSFADQTEILTPGNVISLDLPNNGKGLNGAHFLALHKVGEKYFLSDAKIIYTWDGDMLGNISSNIKNEIAYIRNRNIKSGEVSTARFVGSHKYFKTITERLPGNKIKFSTKPKINVTKVRVSEVKTKISLGNHIYFIYEGNNGLVLTGRDGKSIVSPGRVGYFIMWAGDLDRDGKLDLIVNSEDGAEKNGMTCLLLSSIAKKPQLVDEAACQFFSG